MNMIDLHTHSTASDGTLSPANLVLKASSEGLSAIALTDHDCCDGLDEAQRTADLTNIQFIPGIELEIKWDGPGIFHLLGLGIISWKTNMLPFIENMKSRRMQRNLEMIQQMNQASIAIKLDEVAALAGGNVIGRPHFAAWLVKHHHCKTIEEAFESFLTPGKPFYVPYNGISLELAIEAIHTSGGKAFIAHPNSLYIGWSAFQERLTGWKLSGLDGIESGHPTHSKNEQKRYNAIATQSGLLVSSGSDFHGDKNPRRRLGRTLDSQVKIERNLLEELAFF